MTIETWKAEFYSEPADAVPESEALAHSLKKWCGLLPGALERHGVTFNRNWVDLQPSFEIDSRSCALCVHHLNPEGESAPGCSKCPLYLERGRACDRGPDSPWWAWTQGNKPEPMIRLIETAMDREAAGFRIVLKKGNPS